MVGNSDMVRGFVQRPTKPKNPYYVSPSIEVGDILLYFSPLISCHISFVSVRSLRSGGQTRDVDPMSGYCWPTVYDAEPTLAQYWVTVSCLTPR